MSEFQVQVEKLTGQTSGDKSSSVFSGRVSFADGSVGTLVGCIYVKGGGEEGLAASVKDIFDIASKKLEGASSGSLESLKGAGEASKNLIESKKLDVSFALALFYKNASYVFKYGNNVRIWVYLEDHAQELKFEFGSGHLKQNQVILLATEKFRANFDIDSNLKEANLNLEEFVDGLATEISALSDQSEIGAALIAVKEDTSTAVNDADSEEKTSAVENNGKEADGESQNDTEEEKDNDDAASNLRSAPKTPPVEPPSEPSTEAVQSQDVAVDESQSGVQETNMISSLTSKIQSINFSALKNRRTVIALGVIVLMILVGSAFLNLQGSADKEKMDEFNGYLDTATSKYEEGVSLIDLNTERARVILVEADQEIKKALALEPEDEDALELSQNISQSLKDTESSSSVEFVNVVKVDGDLVSLSYNDGNLVGVTTSTIYDINIEGETSEEYEGVTGAVAADVFDSKVFVFDGQNISLLDLVSGDISEIIEGEGAQDISVFLGNVYLLSGNQIYKYVPVEEGYAQSVNYLNDSETFGTKSRIDIDGSVWVSKDSGVFEYLRGDKQEFSLSGITEKPGELGVLYKDGDSDDVYVVDHLNSALLVFGDDGFFKKAYQAGEFANANGLVVDEENGKFYIAVGNEVLSGNL